MREKKWKKFFKLLCYFALCTCIVLFFYHFLNNKKLLEEIKHKEILVLKVKIFYQLNEPRRIQADINFLSTLPTLNHLKKMPLWTKKPDQFVPLIPDQTMPSITGLELTKLVMAIKPETPIIIATGYSALFFWETLLEAGLKRYEKKPITSYKMAHMIREVLDNG